MTHWHSRYHWTKISINDTLLFEISVITYYSGRFFFASALDQNCLEYDSLKNDDENRCESECDLWQSKIIENRMSIIFIFLLQYFYSSLCSTFYIIITSAPSFVPQTMTSELSRSNGGKQSKNRFSQQRNHYQKNRWVFIRRIWHTLKCREKSQSHFFVHYLMNLFLLKLFIIFFLFRIVFNVITDLSLIFMRCNIDYFSTQCPPVFLF